jgi:hypothetical protein
MNDAIIVRLRAAGLVLRVERDVLHVSPRNKVTPELRALIAQHRTAIIARLRPLRASDIVRDIWAPPALPATPDLPSLLRQHGGFPGIDWQGLALIDAEPSSLWVVQRPDGLLTVLATVGPIRKPQSYRQAWPARFTSPEPTDDTEPAAPAARAAIAAAIARARESPF